MDRLDPLNKNGELVRVGLNAYNDSIRKARLSSGKVLHQIHRSTECWTDNCPIHNPSNHQYVDYPLDFVAGSFVRLGDEFPGGMVIDPDDHAYNHKESVILRNGIRCSNCGGKVFSLRVHDMSWCPCGSVAVDGGLSYLRRVTKDGTVFSEESIVFSKDSSKS